MGGVEALMVFGIGVVGVVVIFFMVGEKYRRPAGRLSPVEYRRLGREARRLFAEISPAVILLGERERRVSEALREGGFDEGSRREWERILDEVSENGFWRRFALVSGSMRDDPDEAIRELRRLRVPLEASLVKLGEAEESLEEIRKEAGK